MDYLKAFKKYISEDLDNIDDKEAKTKFKDLKDKDIDNDGDVDDSDSYLHNKLSNVVKNVDEEEELEEMNVKFLHRYRYTLHSALILRSILGIVLQMNVLRCGCLGG